MDKKMKIITLITSFLLTLVFIIFAVKLTLNFRPLFYFDINYLNLVEESGIEKSEIIKNYDALIDYLRTSYTGNLNFPTFSMSEEGKIHFEDVKNIFVKLDFLMFFSLIIGIVGIHYLNKNKNYLYLRYTSFFLIFLPIILVMPLLINFNASFTIFHKLLFRNEYWIFDPSTDPIINVLPEAFFMQCAFIILVIIFIESIILNILYKKLLAKYIKKIQK